MALRSLADSLAARFACPALAARLRRASGYGPSLARGLARCALRLPSLGSSPPQSRRLWPFARSRTRSLRASLAQPWQLASAEPPAMALRSLADSLAARFACPALAARLRRASGYG